MRFGKKYVASWPGNLSLAYESDWRIGDLLGKRESLKTHFVMNQLSGNRETEAYDLHRIKVLLKF